MPYPIFLHRSFDYQLSPLPSVIMDWAPERRILRAALSASAPPLLSNRSTRAWRPHSISASHSGVRGEGPAEEATAPTFGEGRSASRRVTTTDGAVGAVADEPVNCTLPSCGADGPSAAAHDDSSGESESETHRLPRPLDHYLSGSDMQPDDMMSPIGSSTHHRAGIGLHSVNDSKAMASPPLVTLPKQSGTQTGDFVMSSYGSLRVFQRGTFQIMAGLYAALGLGASRRWSIYRASEVGGEGEVVETYALRATDVLQVEWEWAQRQWRGVLNVQLLPLSLGMQLPLCEYVMQTPWTEWAVQSDQLVLNWGGFLTLYQQRHNQAKRVGSKPVVLPASTVHATGDMSISSKTAATGNNRVVEMSSGMLSSPGTRHSTTAEVGSSLAAPAHVPWWRLRGLKVGAGLAVKSDLTSGMNVYCGCSGELGRGLSFSAHVDVLRRMCCAVCSSLGPLDVAVRLRVNLISLHHTSLDWGLGYRPIKEHRNTTLRLSHTASGNYAGVYVRDFTHEYLAGWIARHSGQSTRQRTGDRPASQPLSNTPRSAPPPDGVSEGSWIGVSWLTSSLGMAFGRQPSDTSHANVTGSATNTPSRWWATSVMSSAAGRVVEGHSHVSRWVSGAWRATRSLDWLATSLDSVHMDLSVGVSTDRARPLMGCSAFVMASVH